MLDFIQSEQTRREAGGTGPVSQASTLKSLCDSLKRGGEEKHGEKARM